MWIIKDGTDGFPPYLQRLHPVDLWVNDRSKAFRYSHRKDAEAALRDARGFSPNARIVRLVPKRKGRNVGDVVAAMHRQDGADEERAAVLRWLEAHNECSLAEHAIATFRAGEHRR